MQNVFTAQIQYFVSGGFLGLVLALGLFALVDFCLSVLNFLNSVFEPTYISIAMITVKG